MIEKKDWDSEFFGYPVGICQVENSHELDLKTFEKEAGAFRLLYIFSSSELKLADSKLVDKKVILKKKSWPEIAKPSFEEFDEKIHDYQQLLNLALLSGVYSRFKLDNNFKNNEFERLYKKWLDNSLSNKTQTKVIVIRKDDELTGMVTIDLKESNIAKIGLLSVATNHQGKGIGKQLLNAVNFISAGNNCASIEVPTQQFNIPAMNLYQKHGFEIFSITHIYHKWIY